MGAIKETIKKAITDAIKKTMNISTKRRHKRWVHKGQIKTLHKLCKKIFDTTIELHPKRPMMLYLD